MAVTEHFTSQETHETAVGTTFRRVFNMLHEEWSDGTFDIYVGDVWTIPREELRVTDITTTVLDNTNLRVTVLYSSLSKASEQEQIPDVISSWEEFTDATTEQDSILAWRDNVVEDDFVWEKIWADNLETGGLPEGTPAPDLIKHVPKLSFRAVAYGSRYYLVKILDAIGKINQTKFMGPYLNQRSNELPAADTSFFPNDALRWLLVSCPIERVRSDCWRYEFTFLYNPDTWEKQHGISNIRLYVGIDFAQLFDDMGLTATIPDRS